VSCSGTRLPAPGASTPCTGAPFVTARAPTPVPPAASNARLGGWSPASPTPPQPHSAHCPGAPLCGRPPAVGGVASPPRPAGLGRPNAARPDGALRPAGSGGRLPPHAGPPGAPGGRAGGPSYRRGLSGAVGGTTKSCPAGRGRAGPLCDRPSGRLAPGARRGAPSGVRAGPEVCARRWSATADCPHSRARQWWSDPECAVQSVESE
jgi:hypothetical protein